MKYIVQFLLSSYKPNGKYFKYHVTNVNKNAARDKFAKQLGFFFSKTISKIYKHTGLRWPQNSI